MPFFSLFGPPNIRKMKARRDILGLVRVFATCKDWRYRAAGDELLKIADASAVEPIINVLIENAQYALAEPQYKYFREQYLCARAVLILEIIGDARAVEPLIATLKKGVWQAVEALAKIGDRRAVEPLIEALSRATEDRDWFICGSIAKALARFNDSRAVDPLILALVNGNRYVRPSYDYSRSELEACAEIAKALGKFGDPRAVEPLIDALKKVRGTGALSCRAAEALGKIGDARAVEPLMDCCPWLLEAVKALDKIGDVRSIGPLVNVLYRSDDQEAVRLASHRLVRFGAAAAEPLIAALRDLDIVHRDKTRELVWTLTRIGDPRAIPSLISALSDLSWMVRKTAAEELVRLYKSGSLDKDNATLILAQRGRIISPHRQWTSGPDQEKDYVVHMEDGIGVDFPL